MRERERPRRYGSELDPPELPAQWWTQNLTAAWWRSDEQPQPLRKSCDELRSCTRVTGEYGRTGNTMVQFVHSLKAVAFEEEEEKLLQVTEAWRHYFGRDFYSYDDDASSSSSVLDVFAATRSWACVVDECPPYSVAAATNVNVTEVPAKSAMHNKGDISYDGWIYAQLLLRPSFPVRLALEYLRLDKRLTNFEYVGVHLRNFEGTCAQVLGACEDCALEQSLVGEARVSDLCEMSERYLDAALDKLNATGLPIYLAHDGQQPDRARAILQRYPGSVAFDADEFLASDLLRSLLRDFSDPPYNAVLGLDPVKPHLALFVDMLMLLRSRAFIGNRASSITYLINEARNAVLGFNDFNAEALGRLHSLV